VTEIYPVAESYAPERVKDAVEVTTPTLLMEKIATIHKRAGVPRTPLHLLSPPLVIATSTGEDIGLRVNPHNGSSIIAIDVWYLNGLFLIGDDLYPGSTPQERKMRDSTLARYMMLAAGGFDAVRDAAVLDHMSRNDESGYLKASYGWSLVGALALEQLPEQDRSPTINTFKVASNLSDLLKRDDTLRFYGIARDYDVPPPKIPDTPAWHNIAYPRIPEGFPLHAV